MAVTHQQKSSGHSHAHTNNSHGHGHNLSIDENRQMRSGSMAQVQITPTMLRKKNRQVGTQIISLQDNVDGFECERDHSFIIIPTSSKRTTTTTTTHHNKKVGTPTIYFPDPPDSSTPSSPTILHLSQQSQSQSQSITTTTSDSSSIYYIKKHKHRRHHLYSKRQAKTKTSPNQREYATITKKQIERAKKKSKQKRNRLKGGNGNRVGAYEHTDDIQKQAPSRSSTMNESNIGEFNQIDERMTAINIPDDISEAFSGKNSNLYEHIEAFNPILVGKAKNHNESTSSMPMQRTNNAKKSTNNVQTEYSIEDAVQQNQIQKRPNNVSHRNYIDTHINDAVSDQKTMQQQLNDSKTIRKSTDESVHPQNDNESIGSFLSMASVRSFPKCNVPESLNRILDPVSITYLDQYDEIEAIEAARIASKVPRIVDTKVKTQPIKQQETATKNDNQNDDETVYLSRTKSDGADPGVIGPVAWQYHKRKLEAQGELPFVILNSGIICDSLEIHFCFRTYFRYGEVVKRPNHYPKSI